jgi:Flp pilus assembly protein protease CpaA
MLAENWFLIVLGLVWIVVAVIQDLRKREVANWWNFSLIAVAFSYRAFLSVFFWNGWYLLWGLIGFAVFFALAYAFYYGRAFAGGDAKLLMGMGVVLPFSQMFYENLEIFIYFIVLLLFCGGIYGLLYSVVLSFKNRKSFGKEFLKQFHKNKKIITIFVILAIAVILGILILKEYLFIWFALIVFAFPFLYVYAKSIEESSMIKSRKARELTIGDWLYKPVKVGKRVIKPNWEGLSEQELKLLQKYKGKVMIKEGIPFTPAFLFAFVILVWILKEGMLGWFYNLGIF